MKITNLISIDKTCNVTIHSGELIGFKKDSEELIHQKGSPGWENSDLEMFPIIGPTSKNFNKVSTKKGDCFQDQHGFLRDLDYELIEKIPNKAIFKKNYKANTKIKNHRFPKHSDNEFVFWPFDFVFKKSFELFNDYLQIQFEFNSDKEMPYMMGYHPAFKLSGNGDEIIKIQDQKITINEVIKKGGSAYPFYNVSELTLIKNKGFNIHIKTQGFDNIMFWTEVKNMVCLEPITQYPDIENQSYSEKNMRISTGKELFSITMVPFKNK